MNEFNKLSTLDKEDYYLTDEGYVVFTEKYLLKRGTCCDNGCRHCPYTYRQKKNYRNNGNEESNKPNT